VSDARSSHRPRLLFTGGGGAGSEALNRLLREHYDVHFADADPEAKPAAIAAESWHHIPLASDSGFVGALGRLCRDLAVDVLVPGVDEELLQIADARTDVAPEVLLPPREFVAAHLDKLTSQALLKSLGLPVPETEPLHEHRRVPVPCVVKPRRGRGSRHVAIVRSEEELRAHVTLSRRPADDFIVQEWLQGQEYTVTMVADRSGTLRAVVPVKVAIKRGITVRAETDRDAGVMAACVAIHAASPAPGCFNIQLVKTAAGDVMPFEVNPRISTTTCLALAAGVDFIDLYLGGGPASGLTEFRNHLRLRRSWTNEFLPRETQ
jgi:carbamoyl-phosphate synthase large subunit